MYIQNIVNYKTVMFKYNSVRINSKTLIPRKPVTTFSCGN